MGSDGRVGHAVRARGLTASAAARDKSFVEFGTERLLALQRVVDASAESEKLVRLFQLMLRPWGSRRIDGSPPYRSNVADDEAPFEFSLALAGGPPELQIYVDPQAEKPTPAANLRAACAVLDVVASELGAPLDRLRELQDLFLPLEPEPPFGLWLGASWTEKRGVQLKIYLNPHVRGRDHSLRLVVETMQRLGFARAWSRLENALSLRDGRDEVGIVSLDLSRSGRERLKLYVRHRAASTSRIAEVAGLTGEHQERDVEAFYLALAKSHGPFEKKPAATVFAFVEPQSDRPAGVALAFPIGSYVESDADARERVASCFKTFGLGPEPYLKALDAFATRPLAARAGIHAHVTLRRVAGGPRIAVYFASEAYVRAEPEA